MKRRYELLSGEKIKLRKLKRSERDHIKSLEKCIAECENHDKEDYFQAFGQALKPMFTVAPLRKLHDSDYYMVVKDMIKRYWYKCFSKKNNFDEYIRKEGLEEEYSRWKKT